MSMEYRLPYTGAELNEKLRTIDDNKSAIQQISTDIVNISENITDISKDIDNVSEEFDAKLENMDIQTTADTTLQGSKDGGVKLNHMVGKTEQKQYSGKNVIGYGTSTGAEEYSLQKKVPYTKNGVTAIRNDDDSVTLTGTTTVDNTFFNLNYHNITTNFAEPNDYILNGGSTLVRTQIIADSTLYTSTGEDKRFTIPENTTKSWARVHIDKAGTTVNETVYPMVRLATVEDGTYEPYVGNAPSPSPAFPQSLNHTGDCVEMIDGAWGRSSGVFDSKCLGSFLCSKHFIPCNPDDCVKVVFEKPLRYSILYYNNGVIKGGKTFESTEMNTEYVCTVPNNVTHFKFNVGGTNDYAIQFETVGKIELTINGKYVGQIVECWKNLIDMSNFDTMNQNGALSDYDAVTHTITLKENALGDTSGRYKSSGNILEIGKPYTISFDIRGTNNKKARCGFDSNKQLITLKNSFCRYSSTIVATSKSLNIVFYADSDFTKGDFIQFANLQIEEGTEATSYEPYTEHIATYYTSEPPRDGDRLVQIDDLWQVERNSAEVVFDGGESGWTSSESAANVFYMYMPDAKKIEINKAYCDKYTQDNSLIANMKDKTFKLILNSNNTVEFLYIKDTDYIDISAFKIELSNKPITMEYMLEEPVYEVLDTASQIALNSLKSFNGVTYVEVDSRVKPQEVSFDYGASHVGARVIKAENDNLIEKIKREELEAELKELRTAMLMLNQE